MGGDFFPIFHVLDTYKGMNEWGSVWGLGFRGYKGGVGECESELERTKTSFLINFLNAQSL